MAAGGGDEEGGNMKEVTEFVGASFPDRGPDSRDRMLWNVRLTKREDELRRWT